MIEKMKFLSITGPKEDIDRVVEQYLSRHEIQIENALSELKTVKNLRPYIEINPYKEDWQKAVKLAGYFKNSTPPPGADISLEDAVKTVRQVEQLLQEVHEDRERLQTKLDESTTSYNKVSPFEELDYDLRTILHFEFIRFRFGRIPREYYKKFESYVYDTLDTIFYKCHEDDNYVSAVYFVPAAISKKIDAIYASLHFERFFMPDEYNGTPVEAAQELKAQIDTLKQEYARVEESIKQIMEEHRLDVLLAAKKLETYNTNFNVRKLAACTHQEVNTFYILCGWMSETDAKAFQEELKRDENTFCFVEDDHRNLLNQPPTKLKNPILFKPFEMFIRMYGLPSYQELDPTILIAVTYSILFGFMFGDVGQGIFLLLVGLFVFLKKKMDLGAILSCCGFFSTIFGFLYGSIFGFETILPALWIHPTKQMVTIPFIGNLNLIFAVAIALGMGIILLTMALNIINCFKQKNVPHCLFDTNGITGMVFYASLTVVIFLFLSGHQVPAMGVLLVMFVLPLVLIFFKEPLTSLVTRKAMVMEESKAMFFVQGFFELFEVLLSYFSNTLSFVRVGAFAVSHGAMMSVVMMLAGAEAGNPNWLVVILGNLFVCGMEGLIVGIQVLRLEYYEIFSRFYKGDGREFKPYGRS